MTKPTSKKSPTDKTHYKVQYTKNLHSTITTKLRQSDRTI